LNNFSLDFKL